MEDAPAFVYNKLSPILGDEAAALEASATFLVPEAVALEASATFLVPEATVSDRKDALQEGGGPTTPRWDEPFDGDEIDFIAFGSEDEENLKDSSPVLANVDPALLTSERALPWVRPGNLKGNTFRSPLLQLHQEILDFCKFISPTQEEHRERNLAVDRVTDCIKTLWPHCKVEVFGSFATGLYLPTSDVDVVVMNSGCLAAQNGLRALAKMLRKRALAQKLVVIAKARVPIVKFVESGSGVSFDISFDVENGPEAAKFIKAALSRLPPLRPLCLVLKIFLQQRELNEVYTGGIGSYALLVMLLVHLQVHNSRHLYGSLEKNLGILLMDFLDLYGRGLNIRDVGVSCSAGGRFYLKTSRGFYDRKRPFLLSVEDPQAPENDIGKNSYNIPKVRAAFMLAHRLLSTADETVVNVGILGRIVKYDKKLISRKAPPEDGSVPTYFFEEEKGAALRADAGKISPNKKKEKKRKGDWFSTEGKGGKRKRHEAEQQGKSHGKREKETDASVHSRRSKNRSRNYTDHPDNDEIKKAKPAKKIARYKKSKHD